MNEDEDAKYGALAAMFSLLAILVMVAVLSIIVGMWA